MERSPGEGKAVGMLGRPGLSQRPRRPRPSPAVAPRVYLLLNIETFSLREDGVFGRAGIFVTGRRVPFPLFT